MSDQCKTFRTAFKNEVAQADTLINAKEVACTSLPEPVTCSRLTTSTMTLGISLGDNAIAMMMQMLAKPSSGRQLRSSDKICKSKRDRLEEYLCSPAAQTAVLRIFGRPWAIMKKDKRVLQESMGFANAVSIMIPDSTKASKGCKVFTNGVLNIAGCSTIDEGLRVAGGVGQVIRLAFGLASLGPHPIETVQVYMINANFALGMSIDREALEQVICDMIPPRPCSACTPTARHAGTKLHMMDIQNGTVLVFPTGKINMLGFKNWVDLCKAFCCTVDIIAGNAHIVRSSVQRNVPG